jgi:hypothetical protein
MSFKFFKNGKEILPPARITWHFSTKPDARFESAPDKLETNANFWRKKLEIPTSATIIIVDTEHYQMQLPTAKITQEDDTLTASTINNPSDLSSDNWTNLEPSISEDSETDHDSPKPKRRKKTLELPDMSSELDNTDGTPTE